MALQRIFVGIDVSKDWLDVWIECLHQHHRFTNDDAGFKALLALTGTLSEPHQVTAAMEATGGYERALRDALLEAGVINTCVLNPLRVRLYAKSLGRQAKNDRIDARIIARYAQHAELHPETLDRARERLAELVTHRKRLIEERVAVSNQAALLRQAALREHARARIALIARQVEATDALIRAALGDMPDLAAKVRLMRSVKGVKNVVATTLAALLPELGHVSRGAVAALAGLAPFDHDSGKLKGTRSIAGGRAPVRTALYMAARAAALSKSPLGDFYAKLIKAGKPAKTATVALMRKMIVTLNAILRDNQPWKHA